MADDRSRIVINETRKLLLMANFKCGFSAINRVIADQKDYSVEIRNGVELRPWLETHDLASFHSIFVSRNPYDRLLSFYFNWLVDKDETYERPADGKQVENWAFSNLKSLMTPEEYKAFANRPAEERGSAGVFAEFVRYLPEYHMLNPHTHPQHLLYSKAGLTFDCFDRQVDTEDLSESLSGVLGADIPRANPSSNKPRYREDFFSGEIAGLFNDVYARDLRDLGYEPVQ